MVRLSISIPFLIVACLLSASLAAPVAEEQKPKQQENANEQKQQTLLSSINAQNIPEPFAKMLTQVKPADLDALPELFDDVKSGKIATGAELVDAIKARSPGLFNLAVSSMAEDKLAASTFYHALGEAQQKLINNYINPPMETGAQIRDKLEENKATLRDAFYKAIPDLETLLKDVNLDLFDSVDSLIAAVNDKTADEAACHEVMDSLSADSDALNSLVDKLMGYVPAQVKDALDSVDASELDGLLQVALSTVTMQYKTLEQLTQDLKAKCPTIMEQVQKQLDPLTDAMPVSLKDDLNKVDASEQSGLYQIVSNGVAAKYSTLDAVAQDLKEKCPNTIELAKMLFSKVNDAYNNVASDVDQAVKDLAKEIAQLVLDLHQKQMDTILDISKDDIGAFRDAVLKTVNSVFEQKKEQNNMKAQPMLTKQQLRERTASMVEKINKNQKQWVAEVNPRFADLTKEEMRHWLGLAVDPIVKPKNALRQKKQVADSENGTTPEPEEPAPFDAREQWPECADVINQIQDQSHCGSCWAVSSASVMSDRICIGSKGAKKVNVSAEDVLACTFWSLGCSGGWPSQAFAFWADNGACTGSGYTAHKGCKPYPFPPSKETNESYSTPKCTKRCENRQYKLNYRKDKHFGLEPQQLKDGANEDIMQAIREGGPVEADMMVYDDFFHYKSGVYERSIEAEKAGGHAVRIIGWGVEVNENGGDDLPYWLVANSWGEEWGENGFFRIIRGEDDCGIETSGINFADASLD